MATNFTIDVTKFPGGLMPNAADTPIDIRTRVETEADIMSIPKPYIGMVVYVKDTEKRYEILTLKDKKSGFKVEKNAAVDTYREIISNFIIVNTIEQRNAYLDQGLIRPGMVVYILDTQKEYRYINNTWKEIPNDLVNGHEHENKDVLDNITIQDITNWNAKSDFSGSYNDLTDLPALPTKFSDLTNDMNLASESFVLNAIEEMDLSKYVLLEDLQETYATKLYVDDRISNHDHIVMNENDINEIFNKLY